MKLTVRFKPALVVECAFWLIGIVIFGYLAVIQFEAWSFNRIETVATIANTPKVPSDSIGRLEIRRLDISAKILEGTAKSTLDKAIGHVLNTAVPGEHGNVALASHRDTFFRPLRNIRLNDEITVTYEDVIYRYRVDSTAIVLPTDVSVLKAGKQDSLTLITCYPFYFIGAAPKRFIVHATLLPQPTQSLL